MALGYRPPYQWERIVGFLGMRAIPGVEQVQDGAYQRIVRLSGEKGPLLGWITVANDAANNRVRLTLAEDLLPALPALLGKVRRLFDLDCDPAAVAETLRSIDDVIPGANVYGLRIPGCVDTFEVCCRAILGQQISVKAAGVLAGRVAEAFGTPVEGAPEGLTCAFPTPEDILALDRPDRPLEEAFGQLGIIASRSRAILDVARLFANGTLNWDGPVDPQEEMAKLTAIKGIGPWTANYVAMRAMGYPDAFLETDGGVAHALPDLTPKQRVELAQQWRPWRSYAVMSLWESLS
ncbi:MAG: AlkA N-terminal domain-containing protein [Coriobacteriia bacterium]|nr:AlkA N-terminal domain-containing protein [Coriobacteriia bacterium]